MADDDQRGKDEMNLAVLPIARLGRNDTRTTIEYYGTFAQKVSRRRWCGLWTVDRLGCQLSLRNEL